jgi:hypothetical protein
VRVPIPLPAGSPPAKLDYIKNQEEHHRVTSFQEEYLTLMSEFGFKQFV